MGRKSNQELQETQLLSKSEILECLPDSHQVLQKNQDDEFALSLYQFTKLIYDNIK
ncbi:hypothetical protein [Yeosuana marina]|uniref:hypothetical protein n=1 Tax=Yeosuana marina TaxID=1565536 RepID=UPI0030EBF81A|tara:strand:+ start:2504 stop:2671 length:168 start_codon:yes stop_codon:yes gene_type:complete